MEPLPPCARCGCPQEYHDHLRDGSDCGFHGRDVCPYYRYPHKPWLERLRAWWKWR